MKATVVWQRGTGDYFQVKNCPLPIVGQSVLYKDEPCKVRFVDWVVDEKSCFATVYLAPG